MATRKEAWLDWFVWPFATLICVAAAAIVGQHVPSTQGTVLGLWYEPVVGFITAFAWVASAGFFAPTERICVSFNALCGGAILAWWLLRDSFHPQTYEPTLIPLMLTYSGGVLGIVVMLGVSRWRGHVLHQESCASP